MVDTKQTKTVGEHHVASELARRGWAPALTRDGLERTDILAVDAAGANRRQIEVQVKAARGSHKNRLNWPLGAKTQKPSSHSREYFVFVAIPEDESAPLRDFVVPRSHVAAAAWISHMDWLTEPGVAAGQRNAPVERARVYLWVFEAYEGRWDLLHIDESDAPVLLPPEFRDYAQEARVGLPGGHPWRNALPEW
ncbi:hypothetical protein [Brachybacterium saurashtrense]|uniref:PD(D/E)XK endonuclease domain-containing protein n=1 Tax=Brachybacterium saurashtrense TaxID=556288 RepID=A0A345YPV0_9MICO|nr:hypothetical protein [Brachybacterium saurashtrense]AXK45952.1 hypothetical protein DWV08_10265 [Brachybacterium saurashtrense]RRR23690.1 hypothetical protein DXU92_02015 [Brachybacterium saurashtrense]